jgi:CheY-like chemotaxis protein
VPQSLRDQLDPPCWNCDRATDETVGVSLRAPSGRDALLPLCRSCYAAYYLPLAAEAAAPAPNDRQARTVLVVEDDPSTLGLLTTVLTGEGYRVETASNGLEALRKARRQRPDAIVLDLMLPVVNGHQFLLAWRTGTGPTPPVLAISAYHAQPTAEELGAQAFLPKPFAIDALVSTVDAMLGLAP